MTETASSERPLVKDALGSAALDRIAQAGTAASRDFAAATFLTAAREGLADMSIMERVRHIADALRLALPDDFAKAAKIARAMGPKLSGGFQAVAVSEVFARHGLDDFDRSTAALADLTRFGTAEFAVRPFLARYPDRMLDLMTAWASSDDEHVRRLTSEGSRPRLPWATRVPALSADPTRAVAILDRLKADPSDYVRRSVANHLNDITKDRPDWVLDLLESWPLDDEKTAGIARHALRSLIKKGDKRALALIGAKGDAEIRVDAFAVTPAKVRLGDAITLTATLTSTIATDQKLVIDYRIHYARKGDARSAKVFKFKTFALPGEEAIGLSRRQPIQDFSTRKHHAGRHTVELLANGKVVASADFDLTV